MKTKFNPKELKFIQVWLKNEGLIPTYITIYRHPKQNEFAYEIMFSDSKTYAKLPYENLQGDLLDIGALERQLRRYLKIVS